MEQYLHDLIAKVLAGEASAEEFQLLEHRCAADGQAAQIYAEARRIWEEAEALQPRIAVDVPAAWEKVRARIRLPEVLAPEIPDEAPPVRRIPLPVWSRWALAAAVTALGIFLFTKPGTSDYRTLTAAARGTQLALSDGSQVTLEEGATLRYPETFGRGSREVFLDGTAFFEVAPDPDHPFRVEGDHIAVQVLGTSFLVEEGQDRIAVKTGRVQVEAREGAAPAVVLQPGEGVRWGADSFRREAANPNDYYFQSGEIRIEARPLSEIVSEISRILAVPVQLDTTIHAAGRSQAVTFNTQSRDADQVIADLCRITGYQWQKDSGGYRIYRAR